MDEYTRIKNKHKKGLKPVSKKSLSKFYKYIIRFCFTVLLTLITLIVLKQNPKLKEQFHKLVFEKSFSFASVNKAYEKAFGSSIPFKNLFVKEDALVFDEKLSYKESSKYLDGVKLAVDKNYLVPVTAPGMIVFVGNRDGYGNTIVIEGLDGVETWYGNVGKTNVKVYDYVEKGDFLGEASDTTLYMVFKKDGKTLDYTKYLS